MGVMVAHATGLGPGGSTTYPFAPDPGALVALQAGGVMTYAFASFSGDYTGTMREEVWSNSLGGIDILLQVHNDSGSLDGISHVTETGFFGGFTTGISEVVGPFSGFVAASGTGFAPSGSSAASRQSGAGQYLDFNFATTALMPGATSIIFDIRTNAVTWGTGGLFATSNTGTFTGPGFRVGTPEPFTMGLGLASAGLFIRRRMKRKAA